jgi:L-ascorbate metabolism protein UlaG (beta-lactamase superfamily)
MTRRAFQTKQNRPPAVRPVSLDTLHRPPDALRLTWIGHASLLLQWPGCTVLTDPMFSSRASPVSWAGPERLPSLPLSIDDLPPVDVVLLSHDHYDHLDAASIRALRARFDPLFLVPLGVDRRLRRWGIERIVAADWWQYVDISGWRFHCTPAQHFSGRGLWDRNTTLWAGWYIIPRDDASIPRLFFAGDTAYAAHFSACRERLGAPDVACLPIGANRPRRIMRPVHMNPDEALQAFYDLNARRLIPIHWGTFDLADEPVQAPARRLRTLTTHHPEGARVTILDIGATHDVPPVPRTPSSSPSDRPTS